MDSVYVRFYLNVASLPTNNPVRVLNSIRSLGAEKLALRLSTNGSLELSDPDGMSLGTSNSILALGPWYRIDLKVGTGGLAPYELRIGGVAQLSGNANLLTNGNVSINIGNRTLVNSNAVYYIDDVQIQDDDWAGEGTSTVSYTDDFVNTTSAYTSNQYKTHALPDNGNQRGRPHVAHEVRLTIRDWFSPPRIPANWKRRLLMTR